MSSLIPMQLLINCKAVCAHDHIHVVSREGIVFSKNNMCNI